MTGHRFREPDDVFKLHVSLTRIEPPIWRRILVDQNVLLPRLHQILQIVMGWTDSHLHHFLLGEVEFAEPHQEYEPGPIDYRLQLNQILPRTGASCVYGYDFGDNWQHAIEVEEEIPRDEVTVRLPHCGEGARACPPEDCGGVGGYELMLEALRDPDDPEHESWATWAGAGFDPEAFDVQAVNKKLSRPTSRRG